MSSKTDQVLISCHCGLAKQMVILSPPESQAALGLLDVNLCHCSACRHSSGLLCASYAPIRQPQSLNGLVIYEETTEPSAITAPASRRYFCGICGCHVFRCRRTPTNSERLWDVATGVIIGQATVDGEPVDADSEGDGVLLRCVRHVNTAGTKDGGLALFINDTTESRKLEGCKDSEEGEDGSGDRVDESRDMLQAHCHCKTVQFHITRPDASSYLPRSNFSDLITPYATSPREVYTNPRNEKWWLRPQSKTDPALTRYLAGTCACRSCRLTSGFEIQVWAFVPRSNIFFMCPSSSASPSSSNTVPLDFTTLPSGILQTYESTPGVQREFCPRCGATVFWHDRWRPDLVDVSVGLLDAPEGARAKQWLDWWRERVSFEEDVDNGRVGAVARWAKGLVGSLAKGLKERGGL